MIKQLFGLMTILTIFNACQKNEISVSLPEEVTIHATIEDKDATKTIMDESNNILWSENDQIIAFMRSSYGHKYQVKPSFVGKSYADFTMVSSGNGSDLSAGNEWEHNVVYYPYSENIECLKSGANYELEVTLPTEQTYVPDSFANGSMAMVAVSESNNITFKNVLGGIKLQLKGTQTVKSIKIEGKNNEKLSGPAVVTAYTDGKKPTITMASDAFDSVTLNCNSGVQLNEEVSTNFIIVLPPILFSQGFSVTITDASSRTYTISTDKVNTVSRSSLLVMPEITLESSYPPLSDYIDEYGINHGKGVKIDEVIWAPVNCGYHKDDFMYGKLYQWGRKYGQGYSGDLYNAIGDYMGVVSDASVPLLQQGPVSCAEGQDEANKNVFFVSSEDLNYEWMSASDPYIWNAGTEEQPIKTENDPCPQGWRVPTCSELESLHYNHSDFITREDGSTGYWFSASKPYSQEVPRLFLPAPGCRVDEGDAYDRGVCGLYWSSGPQDEDPYRLYIYSGGAGMNFCSTEGKARGYSVRCVQESGRS